jgi:hypothetical protein
MELMWLQIQTVIGKSLLILNNMKYICNDHTPAFPQQKKDQIGI